MTKKQPDKRTVLSEVIEKNGYAYTIVENIRQDIYPSCIFNRKGWVLKSVEKIKTNK